jgi:GNAT superfamily N-acetyltransferase
MTDTPEPAPILGRPGQAYEAARLRWASLDDAERLAALWRLAYPDEGSSVGSMRTWLEHGGALMLQDRAGDVLAVLPWREAEGGWEVDRVATHPSQRGQGYGRWLMTKVEALAIRANVPYLWLRLPRATSCVSNSPTTPAWATRSPKRVTPASPCASGSAAPGRRSPPPRRRAGRRPGA